MIESYGQVEIVVDNLIFLTGWPMDNKVFSYAYVTRRQQHMHVGEFAINVTANLKLYRL